MASTDCFNYNQLAPEILKSQIIPVDTQLARQWGELLGTFSKKGLTRPIMDTLIAASAMHGDLILITHNTDDFGLFDTKLHNPWD